MNGPAKLGRKNTTGALNQKPEATPKRPSSRNPLKVLNSGSLPPTHSRNVPKRGCLGLLPSSSLSSSSTSSSSGSFSRPRSLPRAPKSASPRPGTRRSAKNPADPSELRSGATEKNPPSRPRFESLKQVGASNPRRPRTTDHLQRRNRGNVGSEGSFQKKNAEARGPGAAKAKPPNLAIGVLLKGGKVLAKGSNRELCTESSPGRRAPQPLVPEVGLGLGSEKSETPGDNISCEFIPNATPLKDGEQQQYSHTSESTGTATPPVQASTSPEILSGQSMMPTPACFAADHLLAGVKDRRKCRPRGILNGVGELEHMGNRGFGSVGDDRSGCRASLTPPLIMEASMHWLSSSCDDQSGRLLGISSTTSNVSLKDFPGEASVNWLLSPSEYAADQECALENFLAGSGILAENGVSLSSNVFWRVFPDTIVNTTEGLVSLTSSNHENTACAMEFCCSPSTNSSISPFSMILQKASASASCKDLNPSEENERYSYGSFLNILPLSGSSRGNCNVICTPSSPSSNGQVDSMSTLGLHTMAHSIEMLRSSPPPSQALNSGSKSYLPLSALSFQFSHASTPSNSVDPAHFQMPLCHQASVGEEFPMEEEKLSCSDLWVSWGEGMIGRIFEMDEFDCCNGLADKVENVDCHAGDQVSSKLDPKFDLNSRSSLTTLINKMDITVLTNQLESFDFVDNEKSEQQCKAKSSSPSLISCVESFSIEGDGLEASIDSDWSLFYKKNLFQV